MAFIRGSILPSLRLWEFYVVDVAAAKKAFSEAWSAGATHANGDLQDTTREKLSSLSSKELATEFAKRCLPADWNKLGARFHATIDTTAAVKFVEVLTGETPGEHSVDAATSALGRLLDSVNLSMYEMYDDDVKAILANTEQRVRYTRLEAHGPRLGEISARYFYSFVCPRDVR
jgi:glycogen debranching enzyme